MRALLILSLSTEPTENLLICCQAKRVASRVGGTGSTAFGSPRGLTGFSRAEWTRKRKGGNPAT